MLPLGADRCGRLLLVACCLTGRCLGQTTAGSIEAQSAIVDVVEEIEIPARTAGVLATVSVTEGTEIREGVVVASIDTTEADLMYQRAVVEREVSRAAADTDVKVRYAAKQRDFAGQQLARLQRAADKLPGSVSQSELDESLVTAEQAVLDLEQASHDHAMAALDTKLKEADCAIAKHQVTLGSIQSPTQGIVVEVLKHRGEWVEPGDPILRVMRMDRLRAEGLINVAAVQGSLAGAQVNVSAELAGRTPVHARGQIVFVSPDVNPVNGQVRVRAEFDNPAGVFRPGMRVKMQIDSTPGVPTGGEAVQATQAGANP